ncbi:MAG: hypothetical protein AMXMBFR56_72960 [Polyangiaceae bacterium]
MTKVIGYIRTSTREQADQGLSLDAQRQRLGRYASLYDLEIVAVVVDAGVSAKTLDRPGLSHALGMLKSGAAQALLVVKLDRFTRSVRDLGTLIEEPWFGLLSVSEMFDTRSAAGRLVLNLLASVSQWEREAIGERTSDAMRFKAEQGEFTGGDAPYGFRNEGGHLVEVEAEQAVIRLVREARASGLSLRAIARELQAQGFASRTGKPFAAVQVSRMVVETTDEDSRR